MPKKNTSENKENKETIFDQLKIAASLFFGAIPAVYSLYQFWTTDRDLITYGIASATLLALGYLLHQAGFKTKNRGQWWRKAARIGLGLVVLLVVLVIGLFIQFLFGSNLAYAYTFEPGQAANNCWQVRPNENQTLLGEKISFTTQAHLSGQQSMRLDVNLQDPPGPAQTKIAQVDAGQKAGPDCPGTWEIPDQGRIQAWVCLPSTAADQDINLAAEIFLQYRDNDGWHWNSSGPVTLTPGQWTLVRWDAEHDPFATWRNWSQEYQQTRAVALGLEIKFNENSPVKTYQGPLYIDEFVITRDRETYGSPLSSDKYAETAGCP